MIITLKNTYIGVPCDFHFCAQFAKNAMIVVQAETIMSPLEACCFFVKFHCPNVFLPFLSGSTRQQRQEEENHKKVRCFVVFSSIVRQQKPINTSYLQCVMREVEKEQESDRNQHREESRWVTMQPIILFTLPLGSPKAMSSSRDPQKTRLMENK